MIGSTVGQYQIIDKLGEGGMGEVYRARDTRLKRDVALKVLPPGVTSDPDRVARFEREAEMLAALNHPNIAHIHSVEAAAGSLVLVMELVEGEDLAARIARGPIAIDEALPIARQIATALEAAHDAGIIHRDLKPANIKVRADGTVKVLDFGLAKALDMSGGSGRSGGSGQNVSLNSPTITSPAMTAAGIILGTAAYMSPEQARGKAVDKQSDIWAFGAVLYEMLTGQRAFAGEDVSETIASVLARDPNWGLVPMGISPTLTSFLKRCLDRDRKRRLRDIGDMLLALDGALDVEQPTAAAPPPARTPLWRRVLPIAATAAIAAVAGALAVWRSDPAPVPQPVTRFDVVIPADQLMPIVGGRPLIAVSPDGQSVAYKTMNGIYVRTMADLEPRLIPGTGGLIGTPFFSPDGQWLAWYTPTDIRKVAVSGGEAVRLTQVSARQIPVDGASVFTLGASWPQPDTIIFANTAGIMRLSANGGAPEPLIPATAGEQMYGPQLLPDGSVMFSLATGDALDRWEKAQVVVQSPASGQRAVVVSNATEPRYLADGIITYTSGRRLFAARFDLTRRAVIGAPLPIADDIQIPVGLASMLATGANYDVSSSGSLIYLPNYSSGRSVVWINRDGSPAGTVAGIPPGAYEDPRLSPDGKRLLLTRDRDIWVYELDSGRWSRLTRQGQSQMAVWNGAGTEIAYSAMSGSALEAWATAADGSGEPRQLTRTGGIVHVDSWSADGRTISVHQHRLTGTVIEMITPDTAGQSPRVFADRDSQAEGADFARDGRYVVYSANEGGRREIYLRPYPDPGGRTTVSVNGGREPRWAANGEVFYRSSEGDQMFAVQTTTSPTLSVGKPQSLFAGKYYVAPTGSPRPQYDVTSDGKRFLMLLPSAAAGADRPRIVVVQHWLEEVKRRLPN